MEDQPTVVSSADGANVLKELESTIEKYKNSRVSQVIFANENQIVMHHFPRELARLNDIVTRTITDVHGGRERPYRGVLDQSRGHAKLE